MSTNIDVPVTASTGPDRADVVLDTALLYQLQTLILLKLLQTSDYFLRARVV